MLLRWKGITLVTLPDRTGVMNFRFASSVRPQLALSKALTNVFADVPWNDNLNLTSFAIYLSKLMIPFTAFSKS